MSGERREPVAELYASVGSALGVKPSRITDQSSPAQIKEWDSLKHVLLVAKVEERYGVRLTLSDMMEIKSVGDLRAALGRYGLTFTG